MFPDQSALGERVFLSAEVARLAGVSLRQLQWWDERKLTSPRKDVHRRTYLPGQVLEILTVAALRRKGLSLQKIRKILRLLRRELEHLGGGIWSTKSRFYLLTDGKSVTVDDQPDSVLHRMADALKSMYVVCLSDQVERILVEREPDRHRTKQLQLF